MNDGGRLVGVVNRFGGPTMQAGFAVFKIESDPREWEEFTLYTECAYGYYGNSKDWILLSDRFGHFTRSNSLRRPCYGND